MRKPNNATSIADLLFDTLAQMQRWGVKFDVERMSDLHMTVIFEDETGTVNIRVSRSEPKKL